MPTVEQLRLDIDARGAARGGREAARATDRVAASAKRADRAVNKFDGELRTMGQTTRSLLGPLLGLGGAFTGIAAARSAFGTLSSFDGGVASLRALTEATSASAELATAEMVELEEAARGVGASTRFSTNEAITGLEGLRRAGLSTREAIAAIGPAADIAVVGKLGFAEAADLAAATMRQFQLPAGEIRVALEQLNAAAVRSNTGVAELKEGFRVAAPLAHQLGADVAEVGGILGILADSAIKGSEGGTKFASSMAALLAPSREAQEILDGVGLSADRIAASLGDPAHLFRELGQAGLSASESVRIFGRENAAAAAILQENADRAIELTAAIRESSGEMRQMAETSADSLQGKATELESAIEALTIALGQSGLTAALTSTVEGMTAVVRELGGLDKSMASASLTVSTTADAVRTLALVLGGAGLVAALGKAQAAMTALDAATKINPVLLWGTAIGVAASTVLEFTSNAAKAEEAAAQLNAELARLDKQRETNIAGFLGKLEPDLSGVRSGADILQDVLGSSVLPSPDEFRQRLQEGLGQSREIIGEEIRGLQQTLDNLFEALGDRSVSARQQDAFREGIEQTKAEIEGLIAKYDELTQTNAAALQAEFDRQKAIADAEQARQAAVAAAEAEKAAIEATATTLQEITDQLRLEAELAGLNAAERARLLATRQVEEIIAASGITSEEERNRLLKEQIDLVNELIDLRSQREEEARRADDERFQASVPQLRGTYSEVGQRPLSQESELALGQVGKSAGRAISEGLLEVIEGSGDLEDIGKSILRQISESAYENFVTKPLANLGQELLIALGEGVGNALSGNTSASLLGGSPASSSSNPYSGSQGVSPPARALFEPRVPLPFSGAPTFPDGSRVGASPQGQPSRSTAPTTIIVQSIDQAVRTKRQIDEQRRRDIMGRRR